MRPIDDPCELPAKRCAKCLTPMSAPDWIVNKDMAYCIDCANLLHLGESKESRMFSDMHDPLPEDGVEPVPDAPNRPVRRSGDLPAFSDPVPEEPTGPEEYGSS